MKEPGAAAWNDSRLVAQQCDGSLRNKPCAALRCLGGDIRASAAQGAVYAANSPAAHSCNPKID